MPYNYLSWSGLRTLFASRLGDADKVFWTDTELIGLLYEALRTFGVLSGFWRARGTLSTTTATVFYDLPSLLTDGTDLLLSYTVTDQDIIASLQYSLLEPASSQSTWTGTAMFTLADLTNAVQHRRDQFLADTGINVTRSLINVASPPGGRQLLDQSTIDVRRAAWLGPAPTDYYNPLWREDERLLTAADSTWSTDARTPECFSIMGPPPLQLQLAPVPITNGQLELLTVDSGDDLDPTTTATILPIPDDLTPALKWGALADLLGMDGLARDPIRADFCEQRYQQFVQLARQLPIVLHAEINGIPLLPCTLQELESSTPSWQNSSDTPADLALVAPNLIALNPVPDSVYSITCDVVRKAVLPSIDADQIQLGREQIDMLLDYAEHLALFKVGGYEWHATERQANNMLLQSITYNQRISASVRSAFSASEQSQRQKSGIPRRNSSRTGGVGVGALKGVQ
jgi:hypothetical protein